MKTFYFKISADNLNLDLIKNAQSNAKEHGFDEVAFYWISESMPYLTVGVNEDIENGISPSTQDLGDQTVGTDKGSTE